MRNFLSGLALTMVSLGLGLPAGQIEAGSMSLVPRTQLEPTVPARQPIPGGPPVEMAKRKLPDSITDPANGKWLVQPQ